ncbi:hypothetical protein B0T21DRAFT_348365 [Apiosordaria backusii]|uniref:Uncharacterized protein n=1 Tax=Apiosordaria backusii TaxID=314023 RepID=A0AA40BL73_9PEZI|nr:hypothetical protein B0T21DRAFT_348365 [Apiosordaria backusii]
MPRFPNVLITLLLAWSISLAIKIPSLKTPCKHIGDLQGNPDSCGLIDAPSHQKPRRDEIGDGISSMSSDLTSIQAVATASSWVSGTLNETEGDAKDLGNGVHDWFHSDTNGMSNKALLGVIIAVPVIVILAMGWFCWWCCRKRRGNRQSAKRGTIINIGK